MRRIALVSALVLAPFTVIEGQERRELEKKNIQIIWKNAATPHYEIQYEESIAPSTIDRVGTQLEDILVQYAKIFRKLPPRKEKMKVRMVEGLNTFEQLSGTARMAGFYSSADRTLYLRQLPFYKLERVVFHEAFHQYLHMFVDWESVPIPIWFNEGMAKYYEHMEREKGSQQLNPELIDRRSLRMVKEAVMTRATISLKELLNLSHEQFHDKEREAMNYAQSFALVSYFMARFGPRSMVRYAATLTKENGLTKANEKLFGKEMKKLDRIEEQWKSYILALDVES